MGVGGEEEEQGSPQVFAGRVNAVDPPEEEGGRVDSELVRSSFPGFNLGHWPPP